MPVQNFDTIIIGGGLSGLSLALLLAPSKAKIAVVDHTAPITQTTRAFDGRTTAISAGSARILTRAGVWKHLVPHAAPITSIEILDGPHAHGTWPVLTTFNNDTPMGHIVDNLDLRRALFAAAAKYKNIALFAPAQVATIHTDEARATVVLNTGDTLQAPLMIGADGRLSIVRDHARIRTRGWPYDHTAVVATITHTGPHDNIAVEHFLPEGPFAVLPFTNDARGTPRSAVVWSMRPMDARQVMRMDDRLFCLSLQSRLPPRYGDVVAAAPRGAYPLSLQHAERYVGARTALVADAAHGIHPIAGQGLNVGLRDVQALADILTAAQPAAWGDGEVLQKYERARRVDVSAMVAATDGLTWLFGTRAPGARTARRLGLMAVNRSAALKQFFVKQAMGV